ncbi:MAG: SDR family oxidoreductase, partial [Shimia sp.]|uniref:SDR family NAD(P)-dependent oxidoreductase n=1 Tax=Shimia sp. TaxID=1954381 RepID=UPI001B2B634F
IEVVVANAGAADSVPFAKMTPGHLTAMLNVNLAGVVNVWQAALPDMQAAGWGRLIAVASTAGLKGYPYVSGYCAAKHGVVGLTRSVAIEMGDSGITANAICPGFVDTPMLDRSIENIVEKTGMSVEKARASLTRGNPQGRFVEVDEVAGAALWLCDDAARSVNGHAMTLSGGEV